MLLLSKDRLQLWPQFCPKPPFKPLREVSLKLLKMKTPFLNGFTSTISKIGLLSAKPKLCIIYITRSCLQVQSQFCLPLNSRNASSIFYENQKYQKEMWRILNVRRGFKIYICQISCIRKNNALISPPPF